MPWEWMAGVGAALAAVGALAWLFSTPFVAAHLTRRLETSASVLDPGALSDVGAIVVLSADVVHHAPEYGGETVGPLTLERLRYAARLERATGLPVLVTGGRISPWDPPLADIMARVLEEDFGVKARWVEPESRTTRDHARLTAPILRAHDVSRICLVTHGHHMERAQRAFEREGLVVVAAPTRLTARPRGLWRDFRPTVGALHKSGTAGREGLAGFVYRLRS